jgi:AcrR family transcriptional regulator
MTIRARTAREVRTYGEETRELILKAAEKLFAAQGLQSVSMQDIAAEAGVSRATVFNQFGSKILVLDAITARSLETYRAMLRAALDDAQAPTAALLRRLFRQMGKGIAGNQNLYREVFVEIRKVSMGLDGDGISPGLNRETFGILTTIFARGQGRGNDLQQQVQGQQGGVQEAVQEKGGKDKGSGSAGAGRRQLSAGEDCHVAQAPQH